MSRMHERVAQDELAVGTIMLTPGVELVEVAGYSGLDFMCLDMMVTPLDWREAAHMVLAASAYGVTPWLRLSAHPWGADDSDPALPAQALRALSIGAECVLASINTAKQVRELMEPLSNPHRRYYMVRGGDKRTEEQRRLDDQLAEQQVVPIIESATALENLDEILSVPGLKMIYLGMGDLTKVLGHPNDDRHPDIRSAVAGIADRARQAGITVCANTLGYKTDQDFTAQVEDGVTALTSLGIRVIMIPRPTLIIQRFYEGLLSRARET